MIESKVKPLVYIRLTLCKCVLCVLYILTSVNNPKSETRVGYASGSFAAFLVNTVNYKLYLLCKGENRGGLVLLKLGRRSLALLINIHTCHWAELVKRLGLTDSGRLEKLCAAVTEL